MSRIFSKGRLPELLHLSLEKNHIGDDGLRALSSVLAHGALPNLTRLTLTENLRKDRDFLLIDQRGTGDSNSLACTEAFAPIFDEGDLNSDVNLVLGQQITALKDCLTTLDADPRFYTTIDAAADLEAVRLRLGYPAMNLFGVSYGTRIALVFRLIYLEVHEVRVRARRAVVVPLYL